jgi:hypothetical protein
MRKRQHRLPMPTPGRGRKQDAHEENLTGYHDREDRAVERSNRVCCPGSGC